MNLRLKHIYKQKILLLYSSQSPLRITKKLFFSTTKY